MRSKVFPRTLIIGCSLVLFLPAVLMAQSSLYKPDRSSAIELSILKPNMGEYYITGWTGSFTFWGKLSDNLRLVTEIPYSHYKILTRYYGPAYDYDYSRMDDALGNIYVGIEGGGITHAAFGEIGIRIPTAQDNKGGPLSVGAYTDLSRLDAFAFEWTIVKAAIGFHIKSESGLVTQFKIGPAFWFNNDKANNDLDNSELYLNYSAFLWRYGDKTDYGLGFVGTTLTTENEVFYSSRSISRFELGFGITSGRYRPGIRFFIPFGEDFHVVDYVFGIGVEMKL
jgi:hypothetical protein